MLRKFLEFILYGSIFIGICTVAMCMETNVLLGIPYNSISFYSFVFGATLLQYNLHYLLKKSAVENSARYRWSIKNVTTHLVLIAVAVILIAISLFSFHLHHFVFLLVLGIITFLYSVPVLPFKEKKRIKDFGLLKILTITLLWTLVTVWFPVQQSFYSDISFQLIFVRRLLFIFVLCLMFDIRDVDIDHKENIKTIPVVIGTRKAYHIGYALLCVFMLLSWIQYLRIQNIIQLSAMIISAVATFWMIGYSKKNSADYVYLAGIDGMMLLQSMMVIIGSV